MRCTSRFRHPNSRFRAPAADRYWNRCRCCCASSRYRVGGELHRFSCRSRLVFLVQVAMSVVVVGKTPPGVVCALHTDEALLEQERTEAEARNHSIYCSPWTVPVRKNNHFIAIINSYWLKKYFITTSWRINGSAYIYVVTCLYTTPRENIILLSFSSNLLKNIISFLRSRESFCWEVKNCWRGPR